MTKTKTQKLPDTATVLQDTFISIVADASGSMDHLHATVIKGLNDFIAEQAKRISPSASTIAAQIQNYAKAFAESARKQK